METPRFGADKIIEMAASGTLPAEWRPKFKTWGAKMGSSGKGQHYTGTIEFYFRGELYASQYIHNDSTRHHAFMTWWTKQTKNLKGEKYFLWIPETSRA